MKVAIVHEYLNQIGGAERVLLALHQLYPEAPVYTLFYDKKKVPSFFNGLEVRTSFVERIPFFHSQYKKLFFLLPTAVEQFDLRDYEVVISSSSAYAKGVITQPETCHICYCYSPMRYVWDWYHAYLDEQGLGALSRAIVAPLLSYVRLWDAESAKRVDYFIAISHHVAQRIKKYYGRESTVIYPPINTELFQPSKDIDDYYLVVSRLAPYKKIDLAIEAFNELKLPLKIAGEGPDRSRLEKMAGSTTEFLGRQSDEALKELYSHCQALIFPAEEDFGMTPLEVQAAGRPVIALAQGGVLETVIDGETGILFKEQTKGALIEAIKKAKSKRFDSQTIRRQAAKFDTKVFNDKITRFVEEKAANHQRRDGG